MKVLSRIYCFMTEIPFSLAVRLFRAYARRDIRPEHSATFLQLKKTAKNLLAECMAAQAQIPWRKFLETVWAFLSVSGRFLQGLEKLRQYPVDITLENYVWNNRAEEQSALLDKRGTITLLMQRSGNVFLQNALRIWSS